MGLMVGVPIANRGQAWSYVGVPYPTDTQPFGSAWPYDPCTYEIERPAGWTSSPNDSISGYYYVDVDHVSATDTPITGPDEPVDAWGRRFGSPGIPRSTFPGSGANTMQVGAGAYVEINASSGSAYGSGKLLGDRDKIWELNGTSVSPVVVKFNVSGPETKVRTFPVWLTGSSHCIIDGVVFGPETDNQKHTCIQNKDASYVCIRNSTFKDLPGTGSGGASCMSMGGASPARYVMYYNNTISSFDGFNDPNNWDTDLDRHGISGTGENYDGTSTFESYNIWIIDNVGTDIGGNFFQWTAQSFDDLSAANNQLAIENMHNAYVAGNEVHACRQAAVGLKCCSRVVVSQNLVYNMRAYAQGSGNSDGSGFVSQYSNHEVFFILNEITDCENGIRVSTNNYNAQPGGTNYTKDDMRLYWLGNLIYFLEINTRGIGSQGAAFTPQRMNATRGNYYIGFNTAHDIRRAVTANTNSAHDANATLNIWNNIFSGLRSVDATEINYDMNELDGSFTVNSQNNFFTHPSLDFTMTPLGNYTDLAAAKVGGYETNSLDGTVEGSIDFINAVSSRATRNYDINAGSPVIDAGSLLAPDGADVFADFTTAFPGKVIKVDFLERTRPVNTDFDIGAFEKQ